MCTRYYRHPAVGVCGDMHWCMLVCEDVCMGVCRCAQVYEDMLYAVGQCKGDGMFGCVQCTWVWVGAGTHGYAMVCCECAQVSL